MTPAQRLALAEGAFLDAEREIDLLLDTLYDRWQDFEANADEIDVFGVIPYPAAATTLRRAGFRVVTQHDHTSAEFTHCGCRRTE